MFLFFLSFGIPADFYTETIVFEPGSFGCPKFLSPSITTAQDGSLVAASEAHWDNKEQGVPNNCTIIMRTSSDNGKTWKNPIHPSGFDGSYGSPALASDFATGTLYLFFSGGKTLDASTADAPSNLYMCKSSDNGITWSEKVDITNKVYGSNCDGCYGNGAVQKTWKGLFVSHGSAVVLISGRVVVPCIYKNKDDAKTNTAIYSDDGGETWFASRNDPNFKEGSEGHIAELIDGSIIYSWQHVPDQNMAVSPDAGGYWGPNLSKPEILNPACNGDILRYTTLFNGERKNRLISVHPNFYPNRKNAAVIISYDEGKTWPYSYSVDPEWCGYVTGTIGSDGKIHVFYEQQAETASGKQMKLSLRSMTLEALTDGKDKYEGKENLAWCICQSSSGTCQEKCPNNHYIVSSNTFSRYYNGFYAKQLPKNLDFAINVPIDDFAFDISQKLPNKAVFKGNLNEFKPTITLSGISPSKKTLDISNLLVKASLDQLSGIEVTGAADFSIKETITKVELGLNKIRISNGGKSVLLGANSVIINSQGSLEIINGIEGVAGQEKANTNVVVEASSGTAVTIKGVWEKKGQVKVHASGSISVTVDESSSSNMEFAGSISFNYVDEAKSTKKKSSNTAIIAGSVVGVIVILIIIAVVVFIVIKKKREPSAGGTLRQNIY